MTEQFSLAEDPIALPQGAWAKTERRTLRHGGKAVFSLTQGRYRPYLFPLYTPAGFAVTSESPADHPHHNSFWIASDHLHCWMPAADGRREEYTYNIYPAARDWGREDSASPRASNGGGPSNGPPMTGGWPRARPGSSTSAPVPIPM